jgi:hypothetical protein
LNKIWMIVVCLVCSLAHADDKKPPTPKGFWKVLVKPGAKWVLRDTIAAEEEKKNIITITVETYDVRKVGSADVARLRWTLRGNKEKRDVGDSDSGKYTQVAVTDGGLYILSADMDDAQIVEALKKKPSRSDPPKSYDGTKKNEGRYLTFDGDAACMGQGPLPDAGDCPDTCDGRVCISPTKGVTELSGTFSPGVTIFMQE